MRAELDAFFADAAKRAEAEDLVSAGAGEQGVRTREKAVQATEAADLVGSGAQIKMIGVGEQELSAERFEVFVRESFDRAQRADGHEDGGFDFAVRSDEASGAGGTVAGFDAEQHEVILFGRLLI